MFFVGMDGHSISSSSSSSSSSIADNKPPDPIATSNSILDGGGNMDADVNDLDLDLPLSLQQLLRSEWFHHNMTQMLNISVDNLTTLLMHAQNAMTPQQPNIPPHPYMPFLIVLTACYALIFVAGILGNLITCFVISKCNFMHTATNFYLFNLAVSDLILLLSGMPQDLYNLWRPNSYPSTDALCVIESILSETAANATVLTITAFTVERYIAICHPFRQHTMSKLSRAIKFIFAIWIMAFLLALPQAMQFSVVAQDNGTSCTMQNTFYVHVFAVSGFIFFGGPMTAICVLYLLIGVKLKRSRLLQAVPRRAYAINRGISAQGRVIRMLVAVAVAFFLCWAPFHAQRLMAAYGSRSGINSTLFNNIFDVLDYSAGVLYFLSTCINPLLYNIMSHKFREAFKVTLSRHFGIGGRYQAQNRNYSAMIRQNGSMRLHTTVNSNALEPYNSYRIVHLQCRDPSHHLSLQDSVRTTATTTTVHNASLEASGQSCRRNRCVSIGSRATLLASLSKPDIHSTNTINGRTGQINGSDAHMRILRHQVSQLSSMGDANSLLEIEAYTTDVNPELELELDPPPSLSMACDNDNEAAISQDCCSINSLPNEKKCEQQDLKKPIVIMCKTNETLDNQLTSTMFKKNDEIEPKIGIVNQQSVIEDSVTDPLFTLQQQMQQHKIMPTKWKNGGRKITDNINSSSFPNGSSQQSQQQQQQQQQPQPQQAILVTKLTDPTSEWVTGRVNTVSITSITQNGA